MRFFTQSASVALSMMIVQHPAWLNAQDVPEPPRPRMNIAVVEGEAVMNNVRDRKPVSVVVVVRDGNRRPVSGASVTFTLPAEGAGAEFAGGSKNATVSTDSDGYAIVRGIRPNATPGPYRIQVEARHGEETASAAVSQFNMVVESRRGGSGKWIALVAVLGAAAAGGTVAATRNGNGSSRSAAPAPTPIGITPGSGVVGPPR